MYKYRLNVSDYIGLATWFLNEADKLNGSRLENFHFLISFHPLFFYSSSDFVEKGSTLISFLLDANICVTLKKSYSHEIT